MLAVVQMQKGETSKLRVADSAGVICQLPEQIGEDLVATHADRFTDQVAARVEAPGLLRRQDRAVNHGALHPLSVDEPGDGPTSQISFERA